jgi:hypothetical protein
MTLHILPDLEQGSEAWHDQRRGMVTASVVGRLITSEKKSAIDFTCPDCLSFDGNPCVALRSKTKAPIKTMHPGRVEVARNDDSPPVLTVADTEDSRKLTAILAAERITGYTDPTYVNADMWRGIEDEPRAVEHYSEHHAPVTTVGFMVEDKWGFQIGYSPDGLVGDDGLIEVKSRRQGTQLLTVVGDEVPAYNMAQLQCGLLVSGRKWIDYVSYAGGMPLFVKRIEPDPEWARVIVAAVAKFETTAAEMVAAYERATEGKPATERPDNSLGLVF